jgi:hypothetical protein
MSGMTLTEFLTARLDEDEAAAKDALSERWHIDTEGNVRDESTLYVATGPWDGPVDEADAAHIARHDPARVLREVEAKRKILDSYCASLGALEWLKSRQSTRPIGETDIPGTERELYILRPVIESLAAVWSYHPDYDPAWD